MLNQLCVRNFAIVDSVLIDFKPGMSAITGETGAGKSIAIDALSLCLGARAEATFVRQGATKAEITASFDLHALPQVKAWLEARELDMDDECLLRRTITAEGRSKGYINGAPVPIGLLREIGVLLVSIHGQHDHHQLMKPEQQLKLLDLYAGHDSLKQEVAQSFSIWRAKQKEHQQLLEQLAQAQARQELIQYQVQELDEFNLAKDEFEHLETTHKKLANSQGLQDDAQFSLTTLYDGEHNNVYGLIESVRTRLENQQAIDSSLGPIVELLSTASVHIEEAVHELRAYQDKIEANPNELAQIDERLSTALHLARKHQTNPGALYELHQGLKHELTTISQNTERIEQLEAEIEKAKLDYLKAANKLTEKRQSSALKLEAEIMHMMKKLNLPDGIFKILLYTPAENEPGYNPTKEGLDQITYTVSMNAGQKPQPLQKVASGGELSRISLIIQVLTAKQGGLPTLIFDEVDVGVSGPTAATVGQLMRQLGESNQVICVTHLPQVAARAHHQIQVQKETDGKHTRTLMHSLTYEQRVQELARLLGGDTITEHARANAQELLAG